MWIVLAAGIAAIAVLVGLIDFLFLQRRRSAWPGQKPKVSVRQRRR